MIDIAGVTQGQTMLVGKKIFRRCWPRSRAISCLALACITPTALAQAPVIQMDNFVPQIQTGPARVKIDSLELVGVGVSVETWRNHPDHPKFNIWDAIEKSQGSYIISQEQKQYPGNYDELRMLNAKRKEDTVDTAMRNFMDQFPLPMAIVGPAWHGPDDATAIEMQRRSDVNSFVVTPNGGPSTAVGELAGLLTPRAQVMNAYLHDNPDLLWQTLFMTFEQHTDIPAVGVAVKDGIVRQVASIKTSNRPFFDEMIARSYRPKQARTISDNWTFLAMVRRGRIDWLRPYAPLVKDNMVLKIRGREPARNRSRFDSWLKPPATPFVATPYIPVPWTSFQIDQYDHLENLGTVYRPQVVSYLDQHGKPVNAAERTLRMEAALRAALAPLRGASPVRIFYDYASVRDERNSAARFLPLVQGLHGIDADFDLLDPKRGYDLARILGDTGAGSPFVAVALASMAGRQSGGATLVANLRRDDGATLLLVTPPSAEQVSRDAAIKRPFWPRKYD